MSTLYGWESKSRLIFIEFVLRAIGPNKIVASMIFLAPKSQGVIY